MNIKMKKGQIQFMETVFVLFILIIIIIIGIVFVYFFLGSSLEGKKESFEDVDTITFTDSLINMPEFTCGERSHCIDIMKVIGFNEELNDVNKGDHYGKLFGDRRISLDIVYPKSHGLIRDCTKEILKPGGLNLINDADYPLKCSSFTIYSPAIVKTEAKVYRSAVQIYFPELEKNVLGVIKIEVF